MTIGHIASDWDAVIAQYNVLHGAIAAQLAEDEEPETALMGKYEQAALLVLNTPATSILQITIKMRVCTSASFLDENRAGTIDTLLADLAAIAEPPFGLEILPAILP